MYPSPPTKEVVDLALPTIEAIKLINPKWELEPMQGEGD